MNGRAGILLILILIISFLVYRFYRKNFKQIVRGTVNLFTGAPKTGKTLLCDSSAAVDFKRRHRSWWILRNLFFRRDLEEPLFYVNSFFTFGNRFTGKKHRLDKCIRAIEKEHLLREKRFNYGSVICCTESSLIADSMDFNDKDRNARLSLFHKLIGHMTRGGALYYDTQSPLDNHYSIKRVVSSYYYIQKRRKILFWNILYVRELISKDIADSTFTTDVDDTMKKVIVGTWWFKHYDQYYFSYLTDSLDNSSVEPVFYLGSIITFNPLYEKLTDVKSVECKVVKRKLLVGYIKNIFGKKEKKNVKKNVKE